MKSLITIMACQHTICSSPFRVHTPNWRPPAPTVPPGFAQTARAQGQSSLAVASARCPCRRPIAESIVIVEFLIACRLSRSCASLAPDKPMEETPVPKSSHVEPFWMKNAEAFRRLHEQDDSASRMFNTKSAAVEAVQPKERAIPSASVPVAAVRTQSGGRSAYMTTSEAAQFVRLSPRTLERLRVHGAGPVYLRAGTGKRARILYKAEHLVAWLEGQTYGSTSEYTSDGG
jgi:Helix-turn-helix domain